MNLGLLEVDLIITSPYQSQIFYEWYTQQELLGNNAIEIFVNESGKGVLKAKDKLRSRINRFL
jgi:hypothetical protein